MYVKDEFKEGCTWEELNFHLNGSEDRRTIRYATGAGFRYNYTLNERFYGAN